MNPSLTIPPAAGSTHALSRIARWVLGAMRMPAPVAPEAHVELLRLAARYEATQPSYAADLRAAALRTMRGED